MKPYHSQFIFHNDTWIGCFYSLTTLQTFFFFLGTAKKRKTGQTSCSNRNEEQQEDVLIIENAPSQDQAESSQLTNGGKPAITTKADIIWDALEKFWPYEDRPEHLQDKETVALMSIQELKEVKGAYDQSGEDTVGRKGNLIRDVKPKEIKFREGKDDHFGQLHQARWLRLPLDDMNTWWHKTPVKRNEIYLSMDLEATGCHNALADRTISEMHDRRNQMTLKKFMTENVSVSSRPKVETKTLEEGSTSTSIDLNWQKPTSLSQVMEAVHNYVGINHWLYPFCPNGLNILRLMNKYQWLIVARGNEDRNRVELVKTFFNLAMKKLANAANNNKPIASYKELEDLLKSTLSQSGYSTEIPVFKKFNGNNNSNGFNNTNSAGYSYRGAGYNRGKFRGRSTGENSRPLANVAGYEICFDYNDRKCSNRRTSVDKYDGCVNSANKRRVHLCNEWQDDKNSYCLRKHPRKHHN